MRNDPGVGRREQAHNRPPSKVMFVRPALEKGGAEKMLAFVARTFSEHAAVSQTWLVTTHSHILGYPLPAGVKHIPLTANEVPRPRWPMSKLGRYARVFVALRRLVRVLRPDVICAFGVQYTVLCIVACWRLPTKVVGAERGSPAHLRSLWRVATEIAYRLADGVVFQLAAVREAYPAVASRSIVIANPYLSDSIERVPVDGRRPVIAAAFARWDDSKGVDILLHAFQLAAQRDPQLSLQLIGPTDGQEHYQHLAKEMGIQSRVKFVGLVPNVAAKVRDCRVFVLPSRHEGIPNVLLEVLGAGVPTVSCDCPPGGPRLLTANGERGILVPVDDVDAMASAIELVTRDDDLAEHLSRAALGVRREFSPDEIRAQWIEFFDRVASSEPRTS